MLEKWPKRLLSLGGASLIITVYFTLATGSLLDGFNWSILAAAASLVGAGASLASTRQVRSKTIRRNLAVVVGVSAAMGMLFLLTLLQFALPLFVLRRVQ